MKCGWTILVILTFFEWIQCYEVTNLSFPSSFAFGVATSSYQIEGAWNVSGKSVSNWDYLTHTFAVVVDGSNGDVACDSYHKYQDDIAIMKELGVKYYRFSIAWTRILPTGFTNEVNQNGVDYYNNLIDGLLEAGIEPWITMFHWDIPQAITYIGAFDNPTTIDFMTDYADLLFSLFGDRVKTWITINEPLSFCAYLPIALKSYYGSIMPIGVSEYLCTHNILRAHARIYRRYQWKYKLTQRGRITIALNVNYQVPASDSPADIKAAERKLFFDLGWYAYPLVYGDYPPVMKETVANLSALQGYPFSRLPEFTLLEKLQLRGAYDLLAINHYTSYITADDRSELKTPSVLNDAQIKEWADPSWPNSSWSSIRVYPEGFRKILVYIKETYNNPEIVITENGFPDDPNTFNDVGRINYHQSYLSELLKAVRLDGVRVTAYTAWSLMDNFEWLKGYTIRFGLYNVDFDSPNRTRTPKESAFFYKKVIETRCLVDVCEE